MTALALPVHYTSAPAVKIIKAAPQAKQAAATARQEPGDEELISAICLGAEWAIEALYQRYYRYAYALAYRILHESTAAEDIVQEAFLSVWRKAASYQKQQGSVFSWLQAIVHHRAIDRVRAANLREHHPLQAENEQDLPSGQPDVWEEAWQQEQRELICHALQQLPVEQRQVIEMAYFEGYTHSEIAEQKNIPIGTVKGRMRLGLQKMKHFLHERGLDTAW